LGDIGDEVWLSIGEASKHRTLTACDQKSKTSSDKRGVKWFKGGGNLEKGKAAVRVPGGPRCLKWLEKKSKIRKGREEVGVTNGVGGGAQPRSEQTWGSKT